MGHGAITGVKVNGRRWKQFDQRVSISAIRQDTSDRQVELQLGNAKEVSSKRPGRIHHEECLSSCRKEELPAELAGLSRKAGVLKAFRVTWRMRGWRILMRRHTQGWRSRRSMLAVVAPEFCRKLP
jgi:hypothetical protein